MLRDFQITAKKSIESCLSNGCHAALMVMATGLGKTRTGLSIAHDFPGRVLWLAHRRELVTQPQREYQSVYGELPEIEMAEWHANKKLLYHKCHITIASIQTMIARIAGKKWNPKDFDLIVADEAHHYVSPRWKGCLDFFRNGNPDARFLGLTATPNRADEVALGTFFQEVPVNLDISWGIENGWLTPVDQRFVIIDDIDWSKCKGDSDLKERDVDMVMGQEKVLHGVAQAVVDSDKHTIVFTPRSSAHSLTGMARRCAEVINRYSGKQDAFWITEKTQLPVRDSLIRQFKNHDLKYFCNIEIAGEGFDCPATECVAVARPTKSSLMYRQFVGRGLRPLPGVVDGVATPDERRTAIANSDCARLLVLDFVGNSGQHKLCSMLDVLGGNYDDDVIAAATERAKAERRSVKVAELLEWSAKRAVEERQRQIAAQDRNRLVADVKYRTVAVDPFDVMGVTVGREPGYHAGRMPSDKMIGALKKFGVEPEKIAEMSWWKASALIKELCAAADAGEASFKMKRLLLRYGEPTNVSWEEASSKIDRIKENGWRPLR